MANATGLIKNKRTTSATPGTTLSHGELGFTNEHLFFGNVSNAPIRVAEEIVQVNDIPAKLSSGKSYYKQTTTNLSVSLTSNTTGYLSQWHIVMINSTTGYSISFTDTIKWQTALPTFAANKIYEFSIIKVGTNYLGTWGEY